MKNSQEIKLYFEFDEMKVQSCNFNLRGELILFCTIKNFRREEINIVCAYSIQAKKTNCQKIYKIPIKADVISISKYDRIWLRLNDNIYEWDLLTGHTTSVLKNKFVVIINLK